MGKMVTMHQPNYLPWLGLFSKIAHADSLIIYDNAQYTTNSVINRNKVRTQNGWCYLTIPVNRKYYLDRIMDVPLPENRSWQEDHWKTISQNYAKTPYLKDYREFFQSVYQEDFGFLWKLNETLLLFLMECFSINVEVLRASELGIDPEVTKTDAIIAYMKKAGASAYLSGPSGRNYLEIERFAQNDIELKIFNFEHPVYQQRYSGFIPNMSTIDLLFNMGPQTSEALVKTSGTVGDFAKIDADRVLL
ncbi:MAG: WbqC family protein [Dehalococcoidales bacterium]|nr:WbqC family protein [Dehalococcoidales bacterium]